MTNPVNVRRRIFGATDRTLGVWVARAHRQKHNPAGVISALRARFLPLLTGPFSDVAAQLAMAPEDGRYLALVLAEGGASVFPLGPQSAPIARVETAP